MPSEQWKKELIDGFVEFLDEAGTTRSDVVEALDELIDAIAHEAAQEERERILEWAEEMKRAVDEERYCKNEPKDWKNGYDCAIYDLINHLEDNQ